MKDSAWYIKLWQSKMQELPIQGDEHDAWQKMQGLLDQHMPVSSPVIAPKATTSVWIKLLYVLAAIIIAAILYYAANLVLVNQHEKTNKPTGKHARIITDSAVNKSGLNTVGSSTDDAVYSNTNSAGSDANKTNMGDTATNVKHTTSNAALSNVKPSGINNIAASGTNLHRNRIVNHLATGRNSGIPTPQAVGLYNTDLQRQVFQHYSTNHAHSNVIRTTFKNDQQLLADQNATKPTGIMPSNTRNAIAGASTNGTTQTINPTNLSAKKDNPTTSKPVADAKDRNQSNKSGAKSKALATKKRADLKFTADVKLGANTNEGSDLNPFLGIMSNYRFHNKWGISIGANVLSTRIISGTYGKSNLNYITIGDSSKKITHNSGQLTINSTRKIYYVDIPMLVSYKISDKVTIKAGPVISIPIKTEANKNTLGPLSSSADTTTLRTVTPYVNNTTISSKVNFSFSAGAQYNVKRFYFDATYLQGLSPYIIGSGLGSGKIYYRTFQIGVGYYLFKSKSR